MSNFIFGFVVGFIKGWKLTIVISIVAPSIILASWFTAKVFL